MLAIRKAWGTTIAEACRPSSLPVPFMAALIAGESGGHADVKRFEKNVLAALWEVLLGRKTAYGSISRTDLVLYITGAAPNPVSAPAALPNDAFQRVDNLATSWGLTQILGYNAALANHIPIDNLRSAAVELNLATKLLAQFAHRFQLDLATDFPPLFACWNTGEPNPAKTFDPQYCANGMVRMKVYAQILADDTDPGQAAA